MFILFSRHNTRWTLKKQTTMYQMSVLKEFKISKRWLQTIPRLSLGAIFCISQALTGFPGWPSFSSLTEEHMLCVYQRPCSEQSKRPHSGNSHCRVHRVAGVREQRKKCQYQITAVNQIKQDSGLEI